jgi:hypothetical protein
MDRFCCKILLGLSDTNLWTELYCKLSKLLERGKAVQVELTFSDHMGCLDAGNGWRDRMEGFEAQYRAGNSF